MHLPPAFSFSERDHLTRIHLKLGMENVGFIIREEGNEIVVLAAGDEIELPHRHSKPGSLLGASHPGGDRITKPTVLSVDPQRLEVFL